jgi:hypothetical protein
MLTQKELKSLLHYDPIAGIFTWLKRDLSLFKQEYHGIVWNKRFAGTKAGSFDPSHGYTYLSISKKRYYLHRLAFLYMKGRMPPNQADHINHDRSDNRFLNLREVTNKVNHRNETLQTNNKSGFTGVYRDKGRWAARIMVDGKTIHLGSFVDIGDAIITRLAANKKYGFASTHGGNKK